MLLRTLPQQLLLLCLLWVGTTELALGKPRRKPPKQEPVEEPVQPTLPPQVAPVFEGGLPVSLGPLPTGLANISAQGCHACHDQAHETWAAGSHGSFPSPMLLQHARVTEGGEACSSCHLPTADQHPVLSDPTAGASSRWDASLAAEGVTCAACHVRDGAVVSHQPPPDVAPHPISWTETLNSAETCAACHQMTWPGASTPLYDTYGEWQRSAWASVGVSCVDCHMGDGSHTMSADHGRGLSILVSASRASLVRGGPPIDTTITLQNTGAGHHIPSGSPWVSWTVEVALVPKDLDQGDHRQTFLVHPLAREHEDAAPWSVISDTRLAAGASRSLEVPLTLPQDVPAGPWMLRVDITEAVSGDKDKNLVISKEIPIRVE